MLYHKSFYADVGSQNNSLFAFIADLGFAKNKLASFVIVLR